MTYSDGSDWYERKQRCFVCSKNFTFDTKYATLTTHPIGGELCYEVTCPYCGAVMLTAVSLS